MNTVNKLEGVDLNKVLNTKSEAIEFLTICGMLINPKHSAEQLKKRANLKRTNLLGKEKNRAKRETIKAKKSEDLKIKKLEVLNEKNDFINDYLSLNEIFTALKRKSVLFGGKLGKVVSIEDAIATKQIQQYHALGMVTNVNEVLSLVFNGGKFSPSKVYTLAQKVTEKNEAEQNQLFARGKELATIYNGIKLELLPIVDGLNKLYAISNTVKETKEGKVLRINASTCKKIQGLGVDFLTEIQISEIIQTAELESEASILNKAQIIRVRKDEAKNKANNKKLAELSEVEKITFAIAE